jgi:hypothetical protein
MTTTEAALWSRMHQYCLDEAPAITTLDQARFVLSQHRDHEPGCKQYLAALQYTSVVMA